jgi:uncharacterized protein (DUF433 family)
MFALTTAEASAFTGLDEKSIRKDVEQGVVDVGSPPRFAEHVLVYFHARARFAFGLSAEDRRRLFTVVADAIERHLATVELGTGWVLDVDRIAREVLGRVDRFERWKGSLVRSDDVLAGEPVFPNSRLAVRHVGAMITRGAEIDEIREDYPYLTDEDLEFAPLFAAAYPRVGRPRDSTPDR